MSCGLHKNEYFYRLKRTGITCIYIDVIKKKYDIRI